MEGHSYAIFTQMSSWYIKLLNSALWKHCLHTHTHNHTHTNTHTWERERELMEVSLVIEEYLKYIMIMDNCLQVSLKRTRRKIYRFICNINQRILICYSKILLWVCLRGILRWQQLVYWAPFSYFLDSSNA